MSCLFVDQLTVIDFSFLDSSRGIVGESWIVDVMLVGNLNDEGMVFDFGHVKKKIKSAIDSLVDHKLLIPVQNKNLRLQVDKDYLTFQFESARGLIEYCSPDSAVYQLDCEDITIAVLTPILRNYILSIVPDNVVDVEINLRAEVIESAYYHYTHGLKKHKGDCQRICHGHRSRLQLSRNGVRDNSLEYYWSKRWQDIYLVTEEDIVDQQSGRIRIFYEAEQGRFELILPAEHCEVLECDSTVELIAQYIADQLKQHYPGDSFRVKAYEGFNKGAVAEV